VLTVAVAFVPVAASAHPADSVLQRTSIEIQPATITIRIGLLGGTESYRALQYELDQRGDPELSTAEIETWLRRSWIPAMAVEMDGQPILLNTLNTTASFDGAPAELFLAQPLVVAVNVPIPPDGKQHELRIRNDYGALHTEYQLELRAGTDVEAKASANTGVETVVRFRTDPAAAPGPATLVSYSASTATGDKSVINSVAAQWLWLAIAALVGVVGAWLVAARRKDQAARPATAVRHSQASKKRPVAVRTIDAPDE
jgi:hypothetical protein